MGYEKVMLRNGWHPMYVFFKSTFLIIIIESALTSVLVIWILMFNYLWLYNYLTNPDNDWYNYCYLWTETIVNKDSALQVFFYSGNENTMLCGVFT